MTQHYTRNTVSIEKAVCPLGYPPCAKCVDCYHGERIAIMVESGLTEDQARELMREQRELF